MLSHVIHHILHLAPSTYNAKKGGTPKEQPSQKISTGLWNRKIGIGFIVSFGQIKKII